MMNGRNRFPFTATQWQELERQALIFKYMVSGTPIPPDLLTLNTSLHSSSLSSKLSILHRHQPQQHHNGVGWECFQMGFGRKIDPEPGRCRRTDGKKWRCSKEAYPDSKYCERHMHRGRNRSRKPVEVTPTSINPLKTPTSASTAIPISSITKNTNTNPYYSSSSLSSATSNIHFLYPPHSSSSRLPGINLSSQDYRYGCGMKEGVVDEHAFFSESCGAVRNYSGSTIDNPWQVTPTTMGSSSSSSSSSSLSHLKQRTCSALQNGYPFLQLQGGLLTDNDDGSKQQNQDQHPHQHFHVLGSEMPLKLERDDDIDDKPQKVMHHFFDEWPKNKDSWLDADEDDDSEDKSSNYVSASTTQLSISIPNNTSHDFFLTHNG
ncbi:hypothetical protein ACSBR1_004418 [Camellia fascicularis]